MKLRIYQLGLVLLCAVPLEAGCEWLHREVRSKSDVALEDVADSAPKEGEVRADPPKGFFRSTRLPGALSDEAREIERHLGIP